MPVLADICKINLHNRAAQILANENQVVDADDATVDQFDKRRQTGLPLPLDRGTRSRTGRRGPAGHPHPRRLPRPEAGVIIRHQSERSRPPSSAANCG